MTRFIWLSLLMVVFPINVSAKTLTNDYVPNEVNLVWSSQPDVVMTYPVTDVATATALLQTNPAVLEVEPNYRRYLTTEPNDPFFSEQYYHFQTSDLDIDTTAAWDSTTGTRSIVVAVIDTGVDLDHPDLADNMWVNPNEIADNGIDDDSNGYVDDVSGWDFVENDNDANPTPDSDDVYDITDVMHGTHVAGIIGAVGDNEIGIAGVNWSVQIMPLRIFDDTGNSNIAFITDALHYAQVNGADVINMSYAGGDYSVIEYNALAAAAADDIVLVAAAGNDAINLNNTPSYPVRYDDVVLGVAATDSNDVAASYTNYGNDCVDLAAPGDDILSTVYYDPDVRFENDFIGVYAYLSGTSMASPMVAGAAGLLLAYNAALTPTAVTEALVGSTNDTVNVQLGSGRLNIAAALATSNQLGGPQQPTILAYTGANRSHQLQRRQRYAEPKPYFVWDEPFTYFDITGYYVAWGTAKVNPVSTGRFQTKRTYEPATKTHANNKTYRLQVQAVDNQGNFSTTAQFKYNIDTLIARPIWRDIAVSSSGRTLRWYGKKHEHITGYHVYRSAHKTGQYQKITTDRLSQHHYTDTTADPTKTYYYALRAYDDLGNTSDLSEVTRSKP